MSCALHDGVVARGRMGRLALWGTLVVGYWLIGVQVLWRAKDCIVQRGADTTVLFSGAALYCETAGVGFFA